MKKFSNHYYPKTEKVKEEPSEIKPVSEEVSVAEENNPVFGSLALMLDSLSKEIKKYTTKEEIEGVASTILEHINEVQNLLENNINETTKEFQDRLIALQKLLNAIEYSREEDLRKTNSFVYETLLQQDKKIKDTLKENINETDKTNKETQQTLQNLKNISKEQVENFINLKATVENKIVEQDKHINFSISNFKEKDLTTLSEKIENKTESLNQTVEKLSEDVRQVENKTDSLLKETVKKFNDEVDLFRNRIALQEKNISEIQKQFNNVLSETKRAFNEEKYFAINQKILYIEKVLEKFNEKTILVEGALDAPPSTSTSDPLTPLDQNFVTYDQLNKHYRLFINRVQQQLTSLGGGGAAWLKDLYDVNYNSVVNATNGQALVYNSANALWEAGAVAGGAGAANVAILDEGVYLTNSVSSINFTGAGVSASTSGNNVTVNISGIGGAGSNVVYYGNFYDDTTQNVINTATATPIKIGKTAVSNGVSTDGSNITVSYAGVYNIQFSIQLNHLSGGGPGKNAEIWLVKNGTPVANTNTRVDVNPNFPFVVSAWNFLEELNAGDRVQLYWHSDNEKIVLWNNSGSIAGTPDIPSVIVSVVQESSTATDTGNVTETTNLYFTNARVVSALTAGQNITIDANGRINSTATGGGGTNYTDADTYSNVILLHYATNSNVALKANIADLTTANVSELTNLYFTNARVYANVTQLGYITSEALNGYTTNVQLNAYALDTDLTTANVVELNNLYFTNARAYTNVISIGYATNSNVALKANVADLKTANVGELTNLYFTNARVSVAVSSQTLVNATFSANVTAGNLIATNDVFANSGFFRTSNATAYLANMTPTTVWVAGGASTGTYIGNASGVTQLYGNVQGSTNGFAIGYRDIPQISFTGNTTTTLSDAGKHYYSTSANNLILTVANNSSQPFAIGAAINVINRGTGTITITPGTGVTVYLAGNTTSASRVIASYGAATIQKVETDVWFVVGAGIT